MKLAIPGKTFLVGEYAVLVGGKALGVATEPYFEADFKQKHETFLAAAAGIWLFDVIHVIVKGNKNVRESQGLTKNLRLMPNLKMSNASNPFQLSIVKTF